MQVTEEMVRIKAYELWEAGGKPKGRAKENWFSAQTLLQEAASKPSRKTRNQPPNGLKQLKDS